MWLRIIFKILIILFCMWHSVAIAIYSLYTVEGYPLLEWLDSKRPYIRPYVLATSQWQRWNLFSPDPLRRVIEMEIDQKIRKEWIPIATINTEHIAWWRAASELKVMRRLEDDNMQPLQERYVQDICRTKKLPNGTALRLRKRWFVIPKHETTQSVTWWKNWQPEWNEITLLETTCSSQPE